MPQLKGVAWTSPPRWLILFFKASSLNVLWQSFISNIQALIWKLSSLLDVNKALPGRRVVSPPHTPFAFSPATRWSSDHHLPQGLWGGSSCGTASCPSATGTGLSLPCSSSAHSRRCFCPLAAHKLPNEAKSPVSMAGRGKTLLLAQLNQPHMPAVIQR